MLSVPAGEKPPESPNSIRFIAPPGNFPKERWLHRQAKTRLGRGISHHPNLFRRHQKVSRCSQKASPARARPTLRPSNLPPPASDLHPPRNAQITDHAHSTELANGVKSIQRAKILTTCSMASRTLIQNALFAFHALSPNSCIDSQMQRTSNCSYA